MEGDDELVRLARPATAALIEDRGLTLHSVALGDVTAHPTTLTELDADCDVLIVTTKSRGLDTALARVRSSPSLVLPLLNGIEHMPVLRARFGPHVIAGTITVASDQPEPGVIVHCGHLPRIQISSPPPQQRAAVRSLAANLTQAGVSYLDQTARTIRDAVRRTSCPPRLTWAAVLLSAVLAAKALTATASDVHDAWAPGNARVR